jgi:AraC-like DNA-binding protein
MVFLLAGGFVLLVLLLSIMLSKKNKLPADQYLILYLSFATLQKIYSFAEYSGLLGESYWLLFGRGIYLLHAPFFFLYIFALIRQRSLSLKYYTFLFGPFVIYTVHFFYYYLWVFDSAALSINRGLLFVNGALSWSWFTFVVLFHIIEPVYLILSYALLKRYRKKLLESVSDTDRINLNWLNVLLSFWLIEAILLVPVSTLNLIQGWFSIGLMEMLTEGASMIFFFVVGYYGFKQTNIFTNLELREASSGKITTGNYERSGLSPQQAKDYHARLLKLMEEKKPWLNGELTAGQLSELVGVSVNHLSQILNKEQHQNFFDFINSYRVSEVIRKMGDIGNSHLTLLAIALDSGFNSKTSFNTVFKKVTNQTPSSYYKSLQRLAPEKAL